MRALVIVAAWCATARADELAVKDIVPALAAAKVDAPIGEPVAVGTLAPSSDITTDAKLVRAALAARGYRTLLDVDEDGVVTIAAAIGSARATIRLAARDGSVAITPHPSATKPLGACVAIPRVTHDVTVNSHAIGQDGERHEGQTRWTLHTHHALDVDGDGVPDALVPAPADVNECPERVMWKVYVVRGACGHAVGTVGPGYEITRDGALDASGFFPLVARSQFTTTGARGIPSMNTRVVRFAMKRGAYAQVDDKTTSGTCHHCGRWSCTAATATP